MRLIVGCIGLRTHHRKSEQRHPNRSSVAEQHPVYHRDWFNTSALKSIDTAAVLECFLQAMVVLPLLVRQLRSYLLVIVLVALVWIHIAHIIVWLILASLWHTVIHTG